MCGAPVQAGTGKGEHDMKRTIKQNLHLSFLLVAVFLIIFGFGSVASIPVQAASKPAQITECRLVSDGKIRITAELAKPKSVAGNTCYLFAESISESKLPAAAKPIQSKKKAKKMTFTVSLKQNSASSRLYSRFLLAVKNSDGTYSVISNARYISNPGKSAVYKYQFPTAVSKKGLQVSAAMTEDAMELNVHHSVLNIVFSDLISSKEQYNTASSVSYQYHGKTWWFRRSAVEAYDHQLIALKENNTIVNAVLLLGWRDDLKHLIYPAGRSQGHAFYAWNTANAAAREQLEAAISFLAHRYTASSGQYGRIAGWIVGNEVNNYGVYNYAGQKSLTQYARIYANAFRLTYNTVTSVYANARVYISLDHLWNYRVSGSFSSREMLDAFAKALKRQGNISWNLAYHPYSSPLTEPKFWENKNGWAIQSLTSPVINMANLSVLTSYIREKYGSSTRIILSEQGFTSVRHGISDGQESGEAETIASQQEQAAAIAYGYYLAESDDMIDSFILNRHVDHRDEVSQGLDLGLWNRDTDTSNPEWALNTKESWKVFKYMDTNKAKKVTSSSLSVIGIEKWSQVIDGFRKDFYTKTTVSSASLRQVKEYQKTASIASGWQKYGAASSMSKACGYRFLARDESRNPNCLWGFSQNFKKGLSFQKNPMFYTTLKVNGAAASKVQVKLRFFSGDHILESYGTIRAGREVRLGVSLEKWQYRNRVTKIQILIAPAAGGWKTGASLEMKLPVRGK